jgi:hypothetical protein
MNLRSMSHRVAATVSIVCAAGTVAMAAGPAGAAVGHVVLVTTTCTTTPTASVSPAPDGQVRGFVETGCGSDIIDYVTNRIAPGGWRTVPTPYRGMVLATTQDAQSTYLLYRARDGVRVTKVGHDGVFTHGNLLSAAVGGGLDGSIAARGGLWFAVWTEPKASGGFGIHAAGSRNYVTSPKDRILPAGAGVDDSAPSLAPAATGSDYVLAFSRHTSSGYHLMLGHGTRRFTAREIDSGVENPAANLIKAGPFSYLAWMHGRTVRLATTAGPSGPVALHQVALPQAPGSAPVTNPRLALSCGRLYVGFQADTEVAGKLYVDTLFSGTWVRHLVRNDTTAAPVLAGIATHCAAGAVVWTSAAHVYGVMVA